MAAVMITKDLKNSVKERIRRICDAEIKEECPHLHDNINMDASELYMKALWKEHVDLADTIPKDWLKKVNAAAFHTMDAHGNQISVATFQGLTNAYARPDASGGGYYGIQTTPVVTEEWLKENTHLLGASALLERMDDMRKAKEIGTKYSGIAHQVIEFLSKCRSLNEAVRMMPSLKHYLDSDYIRRLDRKVEKKTAEQQRAEELLANIDQDQLAAIAVAAKVQGVR